MDIALSQTSFFTNDERRRATTAVTLALLAGGATQALFWRTGFGLNFWVWDLFIVGAMVTLFRDQRRGAIPPTAWGAIGASLLLGFSVVRYESDWALAVAVPANVTILTVLPLLLRERVTIAELSRLPARAVASLVETPEAILAAARLPSVAAGGAGRGALRGVTRGLVLGVPTAGLFALLLASDPDFSRCLRHVREALGDVTLFLAWSLLSAAGYLVTDALHGRRPQASTPRPNEGPYRLPGAEPTLATPARVGRVSAVTWGTVIGQVALVFALFVGTNLHHLFGGHAVVRSPGAVTYATYLHAGFAELLFATVLSVCLVLAGHALLRPRRGRGCAEKAIGDAVPGGKLLASLEAALLVLTGITVASCWQRLRIYEDAYGASHLRLGVAFVELSVLGVLALTLVKVTRRRWTGHAGAVLAFGAALAVVASGFNADGYIARTNLDRAAAGRALDVGYLASLSGDARAALDHPFVQADSELAERLATSFCAPRQRDLRAFRGLGRCAAGAR